MKSSTQAKSMAVVEGNKSHSIEAAMQGLARPPVPKAPSKPKVKAKPKSQDSSKQTRLSFK